MFLYPQSKPEIKIAEKPVVCKKLVRNISSKKWQTLIEKHKYKYNEELVACEHLELGVLKATLINFVDSGFYVQSLEPSPMLEKITNCGFRQRCKNLGYTGTLKYCVIPKGAEYCHGIGSEILTSKLIVFKSINDLENYIFKNYVKIDLEQKVITNTKIPIPVFKLVDKVEGKKWVSFYMKTVHNLKEELIATDHLKLETEDLYGWTYKFVTLGFHAFLKNSFQKLCVCKAIIPKGAEYFMNGNEIVSNKIIVLK